MKPKRKRKPETIRNPAFLAKCIDSLQGKTKLPPGMSATDPNLRGVITEYITKAGALAWDDERALFWVKHPSDGWQVAVWLMPEALKFEPRKVA